MSRKRLVIFGVGFIVVLIVASFWWATKRSSPAEVENNNVDTNSSASSQQPNRVRLVATGDMIAHDAINQAAKQPDGTYDYLPIMQAMKPFFERADVRFCNQATPAGGSQFGISGYPVFNASVEFARGIEKVGCNLINIGTNHTNDKGQPLIDATTAAWDNRPSVLAVAGANRSSEEQKKPRTFEVKGVKFAFLSYTTYTNKQPANSFGLNMYNEATAKQEVAAAKEKADVVIVSMRWGTEYSSDINTAQERQAEALADAGADIILGHGPHVLQPVKRLETAAGHETIVWFSLGNFLNSQMEVESLVGGFAIMDIDTAIKKVTSMSFMPVYQHYEWTAEQKKRATSADLLARHNFQMVPLDQAAELLTRSQNNTTVQEQTDRVKGVLNKFTEVPIITSSQY